MLYDPRWEQQTKTPSLAGMIAWLETKNPNETYSWSCKDGACLIEQYGLSLGIEMSEMIDGGPGESIYDKLTTSECIALERPHTFGAALTRARGALERNAPPCGVFR